MKQLIVLIIFLISVPVSAETIVPSSRVSSYLNIREQANVQSSVVGTLHPNESAELLESIPYWYHVRQNNGILGYVSKAWSSRISDAEEIGELIRLGSWNIKKLGHGTSSNFSRIAQVIESNFDVLAVVEVMQKKGGHPGYETLLSKLGSGWNGLITESPRPNTNSGNSEFYAIFYRQEIVHPCNGWDHLIFYVDNDGSSTGSGVDHFSREPAFGCFEASVNDSSVGIDFLLAAYHATWSGGNTNMISAEVSHLDDVFETMKLRRSGERDIFIAGDFNLVPQKLHQAITVADRTHGSGSTLNSNGQRTMNLYDHLLVFDEDASSELIGNAEVLDVRSVALSPQLFYQSVSDHLPIVVLIRALGIDDD